MTPLLFNPRLAETEELESVYVGHWNQLRQLEADLNADASSGSRRHWLLIGPRGSGKSHFTELLSRRLQRDAGWKVVRLSEEHYRIRTLPDLLWTVARELGPGAEAQPEDPEQAIFRAEAFLRAAGQASEGRVLVVLENLGLFLERKVTSKRDHQRLRALLMADAPFTLVATATRHLGATSLESQPFFDFFQDLSIRDLNREEITELVERRAKLDGAADLLDQMDEVRARVDALVHLSGGNPRLILALYGVLLDGVSDRLRDQLLRLLDEVTPYYQARLQDISPQMEQVLVEMALAERALTPSEIGIRCGLPTNQVTANLTKLQDERLVRMGPPRDGRSRYWEVTERLFRVWLKMREDASGGRDLGFLLEFFKSWYSGHEDHALRDASKHVSRFWEALKEGNSPDCRARLRTLRLFEEVLAKEGRSLLNLIYQDDATPDREALVARTEQLRKLFDDARANEERIAYGFLLGWALWLGGRNAESMSLTEELIGVFPDQEDMWDLRFAVLKDMGEHRRILAEIDQHRADVGTDDLYREYAAQAAAALGSGRALAEARAMIDETDCLHCHDRVSWLVARDLYINTQGYLWEDALNLARMHTQNPHRVEALHASMAWRSREGSTAAQDRERFLSAAAAWPAGEKQAAWFLSDQVCAFAHEDVCAAQAAPLVERLIVEHGFGSRDSLLHAVEIRCRLNNLSLETGRIDVFLDQAPRAKLLDALSRVASKADEPALRSAGLDLYARLVEAGRIEATSPLQEALQVRNADEPGAILRSLHPEIREAVEMILGLGPA